MVLVKKWGQWQLQQWRRQTMNKFQIRWAKNKMHMGQIAHLRKILKCCQYFKNISLLSPLGGGSGPFFEQIWIPFTSRMLCAKFGPNWPRKPLMSLYWKKPIKQNIICVVPVSQPSLVYTPNPKLFSKFLSYNSSKFFQNFLNFRCCF